MNIQVLIGCEESQAVCIEFRKLGIDAWSCDIQECSGGHPEWHIKDDVLKVISEHPETRMLIAFPPCTYLSSVQTFICRKNPERVEKRIEAALFFMKLFNSKIPFISIENPTGVMSHIFRESDQIIHPFYFGDEKYKRTCLWLKNLPKLVYSKNDNLFEKKTFGNPEQPLYSYIEKKTNKIKNIRTTNQFFLDSKTRSKLSPFIAKAMADQWSKYIL